MVPFPMGYVPGSVCIWSLCFDCDSLGLVSSFDCNQAVVPLACLFLCVCLPWVCLCVCVCLCAMRLCVFSVVLHFPPVSPSTYFLFWN